MKNFLDNELVMDSFLEQFLSQRKTMHLRKIKAEKMSEIIKKSHDRNSSYISQNTGFFNGPSAGVPYPMGPIGMSMPPRQHPY